MRKEYIEGGTIVSDGRVYTNPGIGIVDGTIVQIGGGIWPDANRVDAHGFTLIPGMIDIHTHGAVGRDFSEGEYDAYSDISMYQAQHGVTSIVATLMTMPIQEMTRCSLAFREMRARDFPGAQILGLHWEGPFLSVKNKGAQSEACIERCSLENYEKVLPLSDVIRIITVSPDSHESARMVKRFASCGVIVSGGHDDGCEPYISEAIANGLSHTTHLFCAMSSAGWHEKHKYLGLTEMSLLRDELSADIIADGAHTSEGMVHLAYRCKGAKGLCLVSDMLSVGGLPARGEKYICPIPGVEGGLPVIVTDKAAVLCDSNLNAGSVTPLDRMLRNVIGYGIEATDAVRMVTQTPARIIREPRKGSIQEGMDADICIMNDEWAVEATMVKGEIKFSTDLFLSGNIKDKLAI